jgi:hypothetical protein
MLDGIITLAQCAKYPFSFTLFVRLKIQQQGKKLKNRENKYALILLQAISKQ